MFTFHHWLNDAGEVQEPVGEEEEGSTADEQARANEKRKAAKAKSELDQGAPQAHHPKQRKPQMNGGDQRDKGEVLKERSMQDRGLQLAHLCQQKYHCKAIQRR